MEKEQKDKTLFPNIGKKDVRKYFSPLNISEIDEDQKDEKKNNFLPISAESVKKQRC